MDEDELQGDRLEDQGDDDGDTSGSDDSAPPAGQPAAKDESKRINDLMSKWQQAEARANAAEAKLNAQSGGSDEPQGDDGAEKRLSEFEEFARENARAQLFAAYPKLAQAGLTADDIAGSTLEEMKASVSKHAKLIDGLAGRMRNQILAEHGLSPEVSTGAGTEKSPSFSEMSDEEFDAFLRSRGASI